MIGAFLNTAREMAVKNTTVPEPAFGEVRVRMQQIGICGSDVHLFLGHRKLDHPLIIGHEGLGRIDQVGPGVTDKKIGDRVIIEPNIPCRNCRYCLSGRGNICSHKRVIGLTEPGCFAEYVVIPEAFAWFVPEVVSDQDAVVIEPTAVAYHALFASRAKPGDAIAIIGLGAIGLLLAHLATRLGYRVLVTELHPEKTKLAADLGAFPVKASGSLEQQAQVLEKAWAEQDVCAVFECAGVPFTASLATAAAPRGSEIVLVGLSEKEATFRPLKIAREGITIVPSIIYDHPFDFKRVIQLIGSKTITPHFIISSHEPLQNIQLAMERAATGNESKILIHV